MEELRKGFEVYEIYLEDKKEDIEKGKEVILDVRDLEEFSRRVVRAKVSKEDLPQGQKLWLRSGEKDEVKPEPWSIKIIEDLPDDQFVFKGKRPTPREMRY